MVDVISIILPVVIMLFIGSICRKYNIFKRQDIDAMKKFVVNIALSAVLINAFASMEYNLAGLILALIMFAVCVIAWAIGRLFIKFFGDNGVFVPFLVTGFEAGMLGYAFYTMLYGTEHISEFARIDLGQVLFVFTLYKVLVGRTGNNSVSVSTLVKEMITSPTIISIIAGVLVGITGLYNVESVKTVLDACTSFVSAPTSAVILLAIGYDLVFDKIPWASTCKAVVLRIIIMICVRVVLGFVLRPLGLSTDAFYALNVMLILPPPYVISVFTDDEEKQTFLSSTLTVSTLITIIGFIGLAIFTV